MKRLDRLTSEPSQQYTLIGENGDQVVFRLRFIPTQGQWVFDVEYGDFSSCGNVLNVSPNVVRGYRKLVPFGLAVASTDGLDPFYIDDFVIGRVKVWLLSNEEVSQVEQEYFA